MGDDGERAPWDEAKFKGAFAEKSCYSQRGRRKPSRIRCPSPAPTNTWRAPITRSVLSVFPREPIGWSDPGGTLSITADNNDRLSGTDGPTSAIGRWRRIVIYILIAIIVVVLVDHIGPAGAAALALAALKKGAAEAIATKTRELFADRVGNCRTCEA